MDTDLFLEQIQFRLSLIESELMRAKDMLKDVYIAYKNSQPELWSNSGNHATD